MAMKFHPPTRKHCSECELLGNDHSPIIDSNRGKASSAGNFDIHNWYNFTLGYTPEFPDFVLSRTNNLNKNSVVLDPFLGSGTTSVCAKDMGFNSVGIEANDFFAFAAGVKLDWTIDTSTALMILQNILPKIKRQSEKYAWPRASAKGNQLEFEIPGSGSKSFNDLAEKHRPQELVEKYISNAPFAKLVIIQKELEKIEWPSNKMEKFFFLGLSSSILPVSNVRYGPGFGVVKPKLDAPVIETFEKKMRRMISDIETKQSQRNSFPNSKVVLGDSRLLSKYLEPNSVDIIITSPPYPGDHEYTKHSRLELMFSDLARDLADFRTIKKRMLRGSTTNIYKDDNEGVLVKDIVEIERVVRLIDERLLEDGATSGFEKLYTKLIWEYFGGMLLVFQEAYKVMKPGSTFSLLVSDSHAFKMVHIHTAQLLALVAEKAGFQDSKIELWQLKGTTSHQYKLLENIITVKKP